MATTRKSTNGGDEYERAAAGLDYDSPMADRGSPSALLDEIENLLPEEWREHIRQFPLTAVVIGVGVGVFLGLKKGDELIAAGSSMMSAAAMANVSRILERDKE